MKINIYEYPTDTALLPAYRIAVMQAALNGAKVECMSRIVCDSHAWYEMVCAPAWNWRDNNYRIVKTAEPAKPTTIMGWLLTLPQPYRTMAIRNLSDCKADMPCNSMVSATGDGFKWKITPEGNDFWYAVYYHYFSNGNHKLPEVPQPKKLVPWTSVTAPPLGTWFRNTDDGDSFYYWVLTAKDWAKMNWFSGEMLPFDDWRGVYYSTDQGKTWSMCGTEE
jgi:hypothetical protein